MGFTTLQRSDEGVDALEYGLYQLGSDPSQTVYRTPGVRIRRPTAGVVFLLYCGDVVGNNTAVDVWVETRFGDYWFEVVLLPQMQYGDASRNNNAWAHKISATEPSLASTSTRGAGFVEDNVRHLIGEEWRVKYKITNDADSGVIGAYFGVKIIPIG